MHWLVGLRGGPQRVNHAAVIVEEKIYSFGGYCSGENYQVERPIDLHILNTENLRWQLCPPPQESDHEAPFQRYGHTSVALGPKIFLWGGRNDEAACNKLYSFDTATLKWTCVKTEGTTPAARDGHSACVIDNCMYIFGGFEEEEDRFSQEVYKLDLKTFVWSYIKGKGEPPSYRDFHSASAIGHRMYVFGGRGDLRAPNHSQSDVYCNNISYFDVRSQMWHTPVTTGDIPVGRRSHCAFVYNEEIYIFGGYNSLRGMHFNDMYRFLPQSNRWEELKPLGQPPCRRRRPSCAVYGNRMFLFGGTSPVENPETPEVFENDPDLKLNDHDDLHILEFEPRLLTLSLLAVIRERLDTSQLPNELKMEIRMMTTPNVIPREPSTG